MLQNAVRVRSKIQAAAGLGAVGGNPDDRWVRQNITTTFIALLRDQRFMKNLQIKCVLPVSAHRPPSSA